MKKLVLSSLTLIGLLVCLASTIHAQGVGIGVALPLSTLDVAGSAASAISTTAISSATMLDATMSTVIATPSSAYTITLPALAGSTRRIYTIIYNGVPATNTITINGNGASIVSNGTVLSNFLLTGGNVTLQNNGTNWYVSSASTPCSGAPSAPGTLTGPKAVCANSTGNIYYVPALSNAATYNWTLPAGATITAGQGTNAITVTWGSTPGNITVTASNGCGTSSASAPLAVIISAVIAVDATAQVSGTYPSTTNFTINTTFANEIILIGLGGYANAFNGTVTVTGASTPSQVTSVSAGPVMVLFACVANTAGSHTISVTWGSAWNIGYQDMAYAASFSGFCGTPTVAANVQATTATGSSTSSSVTGSITPASANSCLFADYWNFTNSASTGTVTWTNNTLIRTDHVASLDGSLAVTPLATVLGVTVTAVDNLGAFNTSSTVMILAVVHP